MVLDKTQMVGFTAQPAPTEKEEGTASEMI